MEVVKFNFDPKNKVSTNVLIIGGIHGDEIGTVKVACNLINLLQDSARDSFDNIEEVIIIPHANFEGMRVHSREQVSYYNDLNRSWSEHNERQELTDYIKNAGVVIDLHSSELCDRIFLLDRKMKRISDLIKFCDDNNMHYCIQDNYSDTIKILSDSQDKIGITWEQTGLNTYNPSYEKDSAELLFHLLDKLSLLVTQKYTSDSLLSTKMHPILSKNVVNTSEGIFIGENIGNTYKSGDILGVIVDLNENVLEELVAPCDCWLISTPKSYQWVQQYGAVLLIQPI